MFNIFKKRNKRSTVINRQWTADHQFIDDYPENDTICAYCFKDLPTVRGRKIHEARCDKGIKK